MEGVPIVVFITLGVCVRACVSALMAKKTNGGISFSPFTMWILGIEFNLSILLPQTFTVTEPAPPLHPCSLFLGVVARWAGLVVASRFKSFSRRQRGA